MANSKNLKPFKKGDPRINRKGRPKKFSALRQLAQQIAHEVAQTKGADLVVNGRKVTVTEAILRQWAQSKNPKLQQLFIEVAYGKVPHIEKRSTEVEIGKKGAKIKFVEAVKDYGPSE